VTDREGERGGFSERGVTMKEAELLKALQKITERKEKNSKSKERTERKREEEQTNLSKEASGLEVKVVKEAERRSEGEEEEDDEEEEEEEEEEDNEEEEEAVVEEEEEEEETGSERKVFARVEVDKPSSCDSSFFFGDLGERESVVSPGSLSSSSSLT
jgi:hypothetical protein